MSEPAPLPEPSPFEKMQALAARALAVPKAEIDKREKEWRESRQTREGKRGTKKAA